MDIPVGYVAIDDLIPSQSNTRMMEITPDLIIEIRDRFGICKLTRSSEGDVDIDHQISEIRKHPAYKSRITASLAAELRHIGKFACSLHGDPSNLLNPIRYIDRGDVKEVSVGNNRYLAHLLMNAPYIKAEAIAYNSEEERVELELAENLQRSDLPQKDLLLALKLLQESKGRSLTATEVQTITQKSRGNAASIIKILGYDDPILFEQIRAGYYKSIHAAYKASQLSPEQLRENIGSDTMAADHPTPLFKLLGSGRDMREALFIINEMLGTAYRHTEVISDPSTRQHEQDELNALISDVVQHMNSVKGDDGKYNYDKKAIQLTLDKVIAKYRSLIRNFTFQVEHARTLAELDK